jgi:hypothetical protein
MGNLSHIPPSLPGESMRDYLIRLNAHPSCPNRAKSTPEEMAARDMTHTRMGGAAIITLGAVPPAKGKRGKK